MQLRLVSIVACAVLASGCARNSARHAASPATQPATQSAAQQPHIVIKTAMEHRLVMFEADQLQAGHFRHASYQTGDEHGIALREPDVDFPFTGSWASDTIEADFPFTELLPSWNAIVPENAGVRFDVRVRDHAKQTWSPWLYIGYWGRVTHDRRKTEFDGGKVEIDVLELTRPADAYEIRVTLQSFYADKPVSPRVRRIAAVYSRPAEALAKTEESRAERAGGTSEDAPTTAPAVALEVPFRAQGANPKSVSGSTCSPTSVSMVLAWAGADLPILDNALAIWDDDYALFGNWNRAVQFAGNLGYDAWLERFSTMDQARERLASGQPIIASIRFKKGTFPSNLQSATAGHLIVLRGVDANGDIIVNDPASKDRGHGIVYKADELANAWLVNTGGVGYIITKKK